MVDPTALLAGDLTATTFIVFIFGAVFGAVVTYFLLRDMGFKERQETRAEAQNQSMQNTQSHHKPIK